MFSQKFKLELNIFDAWIFLEKRAPLDSTFHVLENISKDNEIFFQFESFRFVDESRTSLIYVHCDIIICSTDEPSFQQCINDSWHENEPKKEVSSMKRNVKPSSHQKKNVLDYIRKRNTFKLSAQTPILKLKSKSKNDQYLSRIPRNTFDVLLGSSRANCVFNAHFSIPLFCYFFFLSNVFLLII